MQVRVGNSGSELFGGNFVAPFEQALKAAMGVGTADKFSQFAERKFILDGVFEPTGVFTFRNEFVSVLPVAEGASAHDVAKHLIG